MRDDNVDRVEPFTVRKNDPKTHGWEVNSASLVIGSGGAINGRALRLESLVGSVERGLVGEELEFSL